MCHKLQPSGGRSKRPTTTQLWAVADGPALANGALSASNRIQAAATSAQWETAGASYLPSPANDGSAAAIAKGLHQKPRRAANDHQAADTNRRTDGSHRDDSRRSTATRHRGAAASCQPPSQSRHLPQPRSRRSPFHSHPLLFSSLPLSFRIPPPLSPRFTRWSLPKGHHSSRSRWLPPGRPPTFPVAAARHLAASNGRG